ncbi:hypothetical protein DFP73DRAFT_526431 [Morchella snyderi]|nr:hypothetical protein DFP73DRAFT_526431 [Morchella snyderi]
MARVFNTKHRNSICVGAYLCVLVESLPQRPKSTKPIKLNKLNKLNKLGKITIRIPSNLKRLWELIKITKPITIKLGKIANLMMPALRKSTSKPTSNVILQNNLNIQLRLHVLHVLDAADIDAWAVHRASFNKPPTRPEGQY